WFMVPKRVQSWRSGLSMNRTAAVSEGPAAACPNWIGILATPSVIGNALRLAFQAQSRSGRCRSALVHGPNACPIWEIEATHEPCEPREASWRCAAAPLLLSSPISKAPGHWAHFARGWACADSGRPKNQTDQTPRLAENVSSLARFDRSSPTVRRL